MKTFISDINKAFESRVRLGIMSALLGAGSLDFSALKELLELTDGNLSSHLSALEKLSFITSKKQFLGKKPNTRYEVTEKGREAFEEHLKALEKLIKQPYKP